MDKAQFWQLIEASQNKKRDCEKQTAKLEQLLVKLDAEEILSFDGIFSSLWKEAYNWDLWAVAYIVGGGCSDDSFMDFRRWLIGQGQGYFEAALRDPERAADALKDDDCFCEELGYAAGNAYKRKTGIDMLEVFLERQRQNPTEPLQELPQPTGTAWTEEELEVRFPRLCARFG